jgi:hypothetical protein
MNGNAGGCKGLLVVVAGVALLTAACSGASANPPSSDSSSPGTTASAASSAAADPGTSGTTGGSSTYQKAVAYAHCMRQHGVPNFPDPLPNGGFGLDPSVTGGTNGQVSPQYQAAESACASLSPSARCPRSNSSMTLISCSGSPPACARMA